MNSLKKQILSAALLGLVAIAAAWVIIPIALADTAPITSRSTYPYGLTTAKETWACASPCTVNATQVTVLNANQTRSTAVLCNEGTAVLYVCLAALCPGITSHDFALKAGTGANDGSGGCVTLGGQTGRLWQGVVTATGTSTAVGGAAY